AQPSTTVAAVDPWSTTGRSATPSPLKSPTAKERTTVPVGKVGVTWEEPIAVTQQHRDGVGTPVGHRQVGDPIAVEVAHGDENSMRARGEVPRCLEGPIAVAQQQRGEGGRKVNHADHQEYGNIVAIQDQRRK